MEKHVYLVGDLVYWEKHPDKVFTIEELDDKNHLTYDRIWIWSSAFKPQKKEAAKANTKKKS